MGQIRDRERIWTGYVTADRSGNSCYGKRSEGADYGQWEVDDIVVEGGGDVADKRWCVEDTIKLGQEDTMFDHTILRLEVAKYDGSVTKALAALNAGEVECGEGVCIMYSDGNEEFFLLVREDKKGDGLRVFHDQRDHVRAQEEKARKR